MVQSFKIISPAEKISDSLSKLLDNDLSGLSNSSGADFPESVRESQIGMWVDRADVKAIYRLDSVDPIKWTKIIDYSGSSKNDEPVVPTRETIDRDFQPSHPNLTAFSKIEPQSYTIPFFQTVSEDSIVMGTIPVNSWSIQWLQQENVDVVVKNLGLGKLALRDEIVGNEDIKDNTITLDKLAFDVASAGYDTGDFLETFTTKSIDDGWVELKDGAMIGDSQSYEGTKPEGLVADDRCKKLFKCLYALNGLKLYKPDGSEVASKFDPEEDWDKHYRLELPNTTGKITVGTSSMADLGKTENITMATYSQTGETVTFSKVFARNYIRL